MSDGQGRDIFESGRHQGRSEPDDGRDTGFFAELREHYTKQIVGWTLFVILVIVFLICVSCQS